MELLLKKRYEVWDSRIGQWGNEEWIDITFPEKLVTIAWCGLPYLIWLVADDLSVVYKISLSIVIRLKLMSYNRIR